MTIPFQKIPTIPRSVFDYNLHVYQFNFFFNFNIIEVVIRNEKSFNFDLTTKDNNGRTGFALLLPRDFQCIINLIKKVMPNVTDEIIEEYKQINNSDLFK